MRKKGNKSDYDRPTTIIGEDTVIETTNLKSESSLQINGNIIGDIEVTSSVVIGQTGHVEGRVKAEFVLVAGEVTGNIDVSQQIHLTKTANIVGDIICASIVIDEGASIEGVFKMRKDKSEQPSLEVEK